MKYLLLIYQNPEMWKSLLQSQRQDILDRATVIWTELTESGEMVNGSALGHPSTSRSIRIRNGKAVITDGPYIESREQLAGYVVVECESPERMTDIASRWPDAQYWGVEFRPLMNPSSEDV